MASSPTPTALGLTRARPGDTVDAIAWRTYHDSAMTEVILDAPANRGLAALGLILPAGTPVALPPRTAPDPTPTHTLW
ncbi:tail protein X [Roseospira visakhapatnamensis]|uniref:Phage tail protein X n=1 Tax=Roseospira visakhapatnamensis TaxID=390880 RepID=A0A7W6RH01_9PROT|nr:tail protein X [Roseospira visakhapatnamensis]MBB4267826.1 phage tail protein X [Roseospira visakhapatnamensis]